MQEWLEASRGGEASADYPQTEMKRWQQQVHSTVADGHSDVLQRLM